MGNCPLYLRQNLKAAKSHVPQKAERTNTRKRISQYHLKEASWNIGVTRAEKEKRTRRSIAQRSTVKVLCRGKILIKENSEVNGFNRGLKDGFQTVEIRGERVE